MDWWNQLAVREQRILVLGSLTLSLMLVYFLAWEPFSLEKQQLRQQLKGQRESLQWMQQAAAEIQSLQAQQKTAAPSEAQTSLLTLVDQSIRSSILSSVSKRIEPKGNSQVRVDFTAVSFNDLLQWLTQLHNQHQVTISSLNLERLSEQGQVKAYVRLERLS